MLICLAAFLYFNDSSLNELDMVDISASRQNRHEKRARGRVSTSELKQCKVPLPCVGTCTRTIQAVSSPEQILHILRHDPCHILQIFVQLIQVTRCRCLSRPGIRVESFCALHECV